MPTLFRNLPIGIHRAPAMSFNRALQHWFASQLSYEGFEQAVGWELAHGTWVNDGIGRLTTKTDHQTTAQGRERVRRMSCDGHSMSVCFEETHPAIAAFFVICESYRSRSRLLLTTTAHVLPSFNNTQRKNASE